MLKRFDIIKISEEDSDDRALAEWIWQSHYWIEYSPGYFQCKWCGNTHTSCMSINSAISLCKYNPVIKREKAEL